MWRTGALTLESGTGVEWGLTAVTRKLGGLERSLVWMTGAHTRVEESRMEPRGGTGRVEPDLEDRGYDHRVGAATETGSGVGDRGCDHIVYVWAGGLVGV